MTQSEQQTTLVLGGTGKTGRRVAQRLTARGLPVRLGSRSGTPPFDWDDEATWAPVLHGVASVYVTYHPDLAFPGAAERVGAFAELAKRAGAHRLVLLSGRGEEGALAGERAVRAAAPDCTIVRSSWFCQNFSEDYLLEPVLSGMVAFPAGDVAEPFIDVDDIADVAVAALTDDRHAGRLYEVTGPRSLTFAQAAEEIGRAADRKVGYVPVSAREYEAALAEQLPAELAAALTALFTEVLDGRNASVCDGVRQALGREPKDFTEYAREAAATGVWAG